MITAEARLREIVMDVRMSLAFCTRLPLAQFEPISGMSIARASWAFPLAGAVVGLIGALVYWLAYAAQFPSALSAALALAATLLVTGCLHEDGLADTADGFGSDAARERKLEIMRDSRIGTYGACALIVSLLLRWAALASLPGPAVVALVLIATHTAARATMPVLMLLVPQARADGLAADAGRPPQKSVMAAGLIAAIVLGIGLGPSAALIAIVLLACVIAIMAWLCIKMIGGQTGDTLGALEQTGEIAVLLVAAAIYAHR